MLRRALIFAVLAWTVTSWAAQPAQRARRVRPGKKQPAAAKPAPVEIPPLPVPPPPPPTPEQMPATAPEVSYRNGQLSIVARNSTLRDILAAVGSATGARVDLAPGGGSERIVTQIGPGPARDVVAALLADSPMDFIILGSNSAPGGIATIVLSPREGGPATAAEGAAGQQQAAMPQPVYRQPEEDEDQPVEAEPQPPVAVPGQPEPGPVSPGTVGQPPNMTRPLINPQTGQPINPQTGQPMNPQTGQQINPQTGLPVSPGTAPVKTPEQLLQELQRMQQQQQQQQQRIPHEPQQ